MEIGIIGAGLSGLALALKIEEAGSGRVTVLEKDDVCGGLAKSRIIDGYTFDLHGGHVFNSKYSQVKEWVFSILPQENWKLQPRLAKILYRDKIINYPFELSLWELPLLERLECLLGYLFARRGDKPDNYYDWLEWYFGKAIALKYMIPYNEKIWAYDLRKMNINWVDGKMPLINLRGLISSLGKRSSEEREMPHAEFYYPLKGGIQSFVDMLAGKIKGKILLDAPCRSIEKINNKFVVNGEHYFDILVSTICLQDLVRILDESCASVPEGVLNAAGELRYNTVTTVLCECEARDISWLYLPSKDIIAHRLVFQGGFSPFNCPQGKASSLVIEAIGALPPQELASRLIKYPYMKQFKLGRVMGASSAKGYVLPCRRDPANLELVNNYLDELGIRRLGRFARHEYWNMDICIKNAFDEAARIASVYN